MNFGGLEECRVAALTQSQYVPLLRQPLLRHNMAFRICGLV